MRMSLFVVLACLLCHVGLARAEDVTLVAADQVRVHASYEAADKATRGVVLVHAENRGSSDWKFLVPKLAKAHFQVVALDLRGQGANATAGAPPPTDADFLASEADVTAAIAFLRGKGASEIAVVGAGIGANLALKAASKAADVKNAVLLSPGLSLHGVTVADALTAWGKRPLLLVVSQEDAYAAKTALLLDGQAAGPKHLQIYTGAGSGVTMLNREPSLEGLLVSWLLGTSDTPGQTDPARTIQVGTGDRIETTGPALEP
jgi:pimeloyl-ACP methyl ester carboxylesterase